MTDTNQNDIAEKLKSMKLELIELSRLVPDPLNTKNHPEEQIEKITQSMRKRWTNPILVDDDMVIVAGHGRRLAALRLGIEKVPVIVLHNLTEAERIQYQIFDNKSAEMAEWNWENLQAQMDRLVELGADIEETGWTLDELSETLDELDDDAPKTLDVEKLDNAPPLAETVKSRRGEIVFDLFSGSGSTMVAAENMGRKCRAMEIDPRYCDVGIQRWQDLFGGKARRESDGALFDDIEERPYVGIE